VNRPSGSPFGPRPWPGPSLVAAEPRNPRSRPIRAAPKPESAGLSDAPCLHLGTPPNRRQRPRPRSRRSPDPRTRGTTRQVGPRQDRNPALHNPGRADLATSRRLTSELADDLRRGSRRHRRPPWRRWRCRVDERLHRLADHRLNTPSACLIRA